MLLEAMEYQPSLGADVCTQIKREEGTPVGIVEGMSVSINEGMLVGIVEGTGAAEGVALGPEVGLPAL